MLARIVLLITARGRSDEKALLSWQHFTLDARGVR
jgi:hypothetical protein